MTTTPYGFAGPIFGAQWRAMSALMVKAVDGQVVTGLDVGISGSTPLRVWVAIGEAFAQGVYVSNTAQVPLDLDAQSSGTRRDFIVLRLKWSTATAVFTVVKGTSTSSPKLTQVSGDTWEIPLATVDVDSTNGIFVSSDIIPRKPIPRTARYFFATIDPTAYVTGQAYNSAPVAVATLNAGDPGWPYRLECVAAAVFAKSGSGAGTVQVSISGVSTPFLVGRSSPLGVTPTSGRPARVTGSSDVLTGSHAAVFSVQPADMVSGDRLDMVAGATTMFQVVQVPA